MDDSKLSTFWCIKCIANHRTGESCTQYQARVFLPTLASLHRAIAFCGDGKCGTCGECQERSVAACGTPVKSTYADGNPKSVQGAKKHCLRLLPLPAAVAVNQALADGVTKYGAANWRTTGVAASVYIDAAERHIQQFFDGGQDNADDSGILNLGHAMACLAIIIDAQWNKTLIDDRPEPCRDTDILLKKVERL